MLNSVNFATFWGEVEMPNMLVLKNKNEKKKKSLKL